MRFHVMVMALAIALAAGLPAARAATITPDIFTDDATTNGNCTLREAIIAANTNTARDNCTAGSNNETDTISLSAGTYTLSFAGTGEEAAATGDLDILENAASTDIAVTGAGAIGSSTTTINGGAIDRIFHINPVADPAADVALSISGVVLTNGSINGGGGGAIRNDGTLTLSDCTVTQNTAYLSGGAVRQFNDGVLTVTDCTFSSNTVKADAIDALATGGAIAHESSGNLTISRSTFSGNTADAENEGGAAARGGAIFLDTSTSIAVITNSTFSGNQSIDAPGAADMTGGAIHANKSLTLVHCTIAGNKTAGNAGTGGGLYRAAGTLNVKNSILSGNTVQNGSTAENCAGTITDGGYNLDSGTSCGFASDRSSVDAKLGSLADNGGATSTFLPEAASPALDAIPSASCTDSAGTALTTDQREGTRPVTATVGTTTNCDVGAVEVGCGNSREEHAETCDDGNATDTDACRNSCADAACGDGAIQADTDECDDGNTTDGDGCSALCKSESSNAEQQPADSGSGGGCSISTMTKGATAVAVALVLLALGGVLARKRSA